MNLEARKIILEHFCEKRSLSSEAMPSGLADMICAVTAPYFLMIECLDQLGTDPTNGLLLKLIDRAYGTVAGSLALAAIGHLREAEILSRSVYESAATTTFIAIEAPSLRLAQFFQAYVKQEREQNRKWADEIKDASAEIQQDHRARIGQKSIAMEAYDRFIGAYMTHCGVDPEKAAKWPSLIDRLGALGRKIDYRTVYAAMCSQTHHDAEDVLNHFIANSLEDTGEIAARMEREADTFSVFMVLFGLRSFVEAMIAVCRHFGFSTVIAESLKSLTRIADELEAMGPYLDKGEFPESWVPEK